MFYCVYFFSPFCFQPVLGWLLSQGLVPLWEVSGSLSHSEAATAFLLLLLCSSLHPEWSLSLSQIPSLFPCGGLLLSHQSPTQIPFYPRETPPFTSFCKQNQSPLCFVYTWTSWLFMSHELHRGIVCCYVWEGLCSLGGPLESEDDAFVISESPVLCWIMVYCHLKSTTVDREEGVCNGSAVNTPVFCTRSSNPFLDGKWCVTFLFFPSFY